MAERIVSPGVFTNEVDQSFLPAGVAAIGAAVIGPTQKGPAGIPTTVTSYSDFVQTFGGAFSSGSGASENSYKYMTNYMAQEYLKYADTLTVVRILSGDYGPASTNVTSQTVAGDAKATGSLTIAGTFGQTVDDEFQITVGSTEFRFIAADPVGGIPVDNSPIFFLSTGSSTAGYIDNLVAKIDGASIGVDAIDETTAIGFSASAAGTSGNSITVDTGSGTTFSDVLTLSGGTDTTTTNTSFVLTTLSDGADQNSIGPEGTNNTLASGSVNNLRYEVTNRSTTKGTFTLLIRRGDDTSKRKIILEQYNNLTLDPNSNNYIGKVIGDQSNTLKDAGTADPFLQLSGSFVNRSKYVRVSVTKTTYNYLDVNGNVRDASLSNFIPINQSGSFSGGSDGTVVHPRAFYDEISNTNTQGFNLGTAATENAYNDAIFLLKNQDEYDINLLALPGLVDNFANHSKVLSTALTAMEDRSDAFLLIDPVEYGATLSTAAAKAESRDSNYAAEYWPWLKIPDVDLGRNIWVPASTLIPSVYAFNDRVAAPWFAPAGLNRGGLDIVVQTERKLTQSNRDTLYESAVNPIATFPNTGVVVYGQKTLQKKASALDRVNVRRLLIAAKKFVASATKFLVFENNTAATRNRFLSIVNPYFENVQQRQGLFAFKVVMDETNNTPDVIDRNEMRGAIYLQPAKTAEFIIIDFNILPTGASFPE